jgi:predicted ATP-dependent serine protease
MRLSETKENNMSEATVGILSNLAFQAPAAPSYKSGFNPILAKQLAQEEQSTKTWVCEGYLAAGGLVLLASKPKVGKSTITYQLAVKVANGLPFLGKKTTKGAVLILALEEHSADIKGRLEQNEGLDSDIYIARTAPHTDAVLQDIKRFCLDKGVTLIILDTLTAFWNVTEENDAGPVAQAIKPLLRLARETDACVLLIHHVRKGGGSDGDEIRGSGALFALVDVGVVMKRHETGMQRKLEATSRYSETPKALIVTLDEEGEYIVVGSSSDAAKAAEQERVGAALSTTPQTVEALSSTTGLSSHKVRKYLKTLVPGFASKQGEGTKGDPFLYRRVP